MTGKEFLTNKIEEEMYDIMYWLFNTYGMSYTNSRSAIIEWLKTEGSTNKMVFQYDGKEYEMKRLRNKKGVRKGVFLMEAKQWKQPHTSKR